MNVQSELSERVPIRPRVAFVLAVADRMVPLLVAYPEAMQVVQNALADGWRWELGEDIRFRQLYDAHNDAMALQGCLTIADEASAAMCAADSAYYYVLAHAFSQDCDKGLVSGGPPSDVADFTEEVLDHVCDFATKTSRCDSNWIASTVERLVKDFSVANADELGPVVQPQYFKQVVTDNLGAP